MKTPDFSHSYVDEAGSPSVEMRAAFPGNGQEGSLTVTPKNISDEQRDLYETYVNISAKIFGYHVEQIKDGAGSLKILTNQNSPEGLFHSISRECENDNLIKPGSAGEGAAAISRHEKFFSGELKNDPVMDKLKAAKELFAHSGAQFTVTSDKITFDPASENKGNGIFAEGVKPTRLFNS